MQRCQEAPPRAGAVRVAPQWGKAAQEAVRACEWPVVSASARGMRGENAKVRKPDIAAHVAGKTSVSNDDAAAAVAAVLSAITDALARGESVRIAGMES